MIARAYTVAFQGVDARLVEVQCAVTAGLPAFSIVGYNCKPFSQYFPCGFCPRITDVKFGAALQQKGQAAHHLRVFLNNFTVMCPIWLGGRNFRRRSTAVFVGSLKIGRHMANGGARRRWMAARMRAKRERGSATSAIWKVI